jgi:hypothetical protein
VGGSVRAGRECPHLRIEIWGTRFSGGARCGPPALSKPQSKEVDANKK